MPESLEAHRKRLSFHCHQRGMLETSLLLRRFAETKLPTLDEAELRRFEVLLDADDDELLDWIVGRKQPPAAVDQALLDMLKNFRDDS